MVQISTCVWLNDQAEQAAEFYKSVFANVAIKSTARYGKSAAQASGQREGAVMAIDVQLENVGILLLNGGPHFKLNPSNSFVITCENKVEIDRLWSRLSQDGLVRMALDKYPWAERYGWTEDRFGVNWQLSISPAAQKITPSFLFVDEMFGKGESAINFYTSIFPDSKIETCVKDEASKAVMFSAFQLAKQGFALMEGQGKHGHKFNESFSLIVKCDSQQEIDLYWEKLVEGGQESQCGWLKDKFGFSWQVVPTQMDKFWSDPEKAERAMSAIVKMKKIDLAKVLTAIG